MLCAAASSSDFYGTTFEQIESSDDIACNVRNSLLPSQNMSRSEPAKHHTLTGEQCQQPQLLPAVHPRLEPGWQPNSRPPSKQLPVADQHAREVSVHHAPEGHPADGLVQDLQENKG
jgi:hypothetical protein